MEQKELHLQSESKTLILDVYAVEYGYDIDLHCFPNPYLTGSYNNLNKLIDDVSPYIMMHCLPDEANEFINELKQLA